MVEAVLRVEMVEDRIGSKNSFFGSTMVKKVVEDIRYHETDKREDIAPCGVYAVINIENDVVLGEETPLKTKRTFNIKINRRYFDHEGDGNYIAIFSIEEKVYEVWVRFDGSQIVNMTLSIWDDNGSFEDGIPADTIYTSKEFEKIERLFS